MLKGNNSYSSMAMATGFKTSMNESNANQEVLATFFETCIFFLEWLNDVVASTDEIDNVIFVITCGDAYTGNSILSRCEVMTHCGDTLR